MMINQSNSVDFKLISAIWSLHIQFTDDHYYWRVEMKENETTFHATVQSLKSCEQVTGFFCRVENFINFTILFCWKSLTMKRSDSGKKMSNFYHLFSSIRGHLTTWVTLWVSTVWLCKFSCVCKIQNMIL